jgi:DNA transformation protein and related proteins
VGDRSYLLDLFAQYGPIRLRRMFGSEGLFDGDVMIGFADEDIIYLKTDETTRQAFVAEGCKPFVYRKRNGEEIVMSYYRIPDRLYDDPDELADWARRAATVAQKSPTVARKRAAAVTKPKMRRTARRSH